MLNEEVITFSNLRQCSPVVGETTTAPVTAKAKPFVASNAHGLLRQVKDHKEAGELGSQCGKKILSLISSKDQE